MAPGLVPASVSVAVGYEQVRAVLALNCPVLSTIPSHRCKTCCRRVPVRLMAAVRLGRIPALHLSEYDKATSRANRSTFYSHIERESGGRLVSPRLTLPSEMLLSTNSAGAPAPAPAVQSAQRNPFRGESTPQDYVPHLALPFYPRGRSDLSPRLRSHFQTQISPEPDAPHGASAVQLSPGTRMAWWPAPTVSHTAYGIGWY